MDRLLIAWRPDLLRKTPAEATARSGGGFQRHPVAPAFERLDGPAPDSLRVAAVEVVGAQLLVGDPARQEMIGRHQHGVRDGGDGLLMTPVSHNPPWTKPLTR